jgi:hypothetical protein
MIKVCIAHYTYLHRKAPSRLKLEYELEACNDAAGLIPLSQLPNSHLKQALIHAVRAARSHPHSTAGAIEKLIRSG